MNVHAWTRARAILERALELDESSRSAFVASTCADPKLRDEVLGWLEHDVERDADDDWCAVGARVRGVALDEAPEPTPSRIGRYTIVRELAVGGMGVVYEAVQDEPLRPVALKVLRNASAKGASFARFQREAEVLALLDHPVIARIHEAGTHVESHGAVHSVLPYIAMELVPGARDVTSYARATNATIDQCVDLLLPACEAVGFAHSRGVVHRDLKPSNILVGADGRVRVIDFGIARMFDDPTMTRSGELLGTLRYMSAEQLGGGGDRVGPPSDVYALGLILHELVTGRGPFPGDGSSLADSVAQRRSLPPRPRSFAPALSKDLESILLKALDPDRARRYANAAELATDLRAMRRGLPIAARMQGPIERMCRLAALHRSEVAWIAAFVVALLAGGILSTLGWWRASHAREDARRAQLDAELHGDDALAVAAFLGDVFAGASPREGRNDITVRAAMERAAPWIDERFADRPAVRANLHSRFADVFGDLGVPSRAIDHYRAAAAAIEDAPGSTSRDRVVITQRLAKSLLDAGAIPAALATAESVAGDWRGGGLAPDLDVLLARDVVAQCLRIQEHFDDAVALHRRLVAQAESFGPEVAEHLRGSLAVALRRQGSTSEAIALIRECARLRGQVEPSPDEASVETLTTWTNLAIALIDAGELERAERILGSVHRRQLALLGDDHPNTRNTVVALAFAITKAGREADAEALYRDAVRSADAANDVRQSAIMRTHLGKLLLRGRRFADAEQELAVADAAARASGDDAQRYETAPLLGEALGEQGKYAAAAALFDEAVAVSIALRGASAKSTMVLRYNHARMLASCGRRVESKRIVDALLADPAIDPETRERATEALGQLEAALARSNASTDPGPR
ncbi:MAG: serine/threonine protein kinase [Planctomycetes bacterium]|nr:serine/threonine protein kinase [Planctomycetota bacterium]